MTGYRVLVDGYNVIKQHPVWCRLPLANGRQQLLQALQQTRWPVPVARIDVVFDSAHPVDGLPAQTARIRVTFATPSADDVIQRLIRQSEEPARVVVISNDHVIVGTAKSHGALHHSVAWLFERTHPPRASTAPEQESRRPVSVREMQRINAELARRWGCDDQASSPPPRSTKRKAC